MAKQETEGHSRWSKESKQQRKVGKAWGVYLEQRKVHFAGTQSRGRRRWRGEGNACAIWKMKQSQRGPGQRCQAPGRIPLIYILINCHLSQPVMTPGSLALWHAGAAVCFLTVGYLPTDFFFKASTHVTTGNVTHIILRDVLRIFAA